MTDEEFEAEKRKLLVPQEQSKYRATMFVGGGVAVAAAIALLVWVASPRVLRDNDQQAQSSPSNVAATKSDLAPKQIPSQSEPVLDSDLSGFAGRYPFDRVRGTTFHNNPSVRAAVYRAAPRRALAELALSTTVSTPIEASGDRLLSWACEAHNCGPHNWTTLISRTGSHALLCYYDVRLSAHSTWYRAGRPIARRRDGCPHDFDDLAGWNPER